MRNMNSGYNRYSMSNRAVKAYESGEKPKSKWTKSAMIQEIRFECQDSDRLFDESVLKKMKKDELFDTFFHYSSWHHTSKMCNTTEFFSSDPDAIHDFFPAQTETNHDTLQKYEERKSSILNRPTGNKNASPLKEPPKQTWWVLGFSVWSGKRHPKIIGYDVEIKDKITKRQLTASKYYKYNGVIQEFDSYEEAQNFARELENRYK